MTTSEIEQYVIRPLRQDDIDAADTVQRLAFGTFLGLQDPLSFMGDGADIGPRWHIDPTGAVAAEIDGTLVGAGYASVWGNLGVIGPMMVHPEYWSRRVASGILQALVERMENAAVTHASLVTFATSPKHLGLYQKHGFYPRFLTAIVTHEIKEPPRAPEWTRFSTLSPEERCRALAACRDIAGSIHDGLDLSIEIEAVERLGLGDVALLIRDGAVAGFAVCHCGPGTEAGSDVCSVKFGAVRTGPHAHDDYSMLLDACETLTIDLGIHSLSTAMNLGRDEAYRMMLSRGYRTVFLGVAMHRPNEPGHNRSGVFVMESLA